MIILNVQNVGLHIRKNGKKKDEQNHICVDCGRQFIVNHDPPQGYKPETK